MKRRQFVTLLGGAAALAPLALRAQQAPMPVIGFFSSRESKDSDDVVAAYRDGLREAGYIAGQNVAIEFRWAEGRYDQLPAIAADLVRRQVAVIFANGGLLPAQIAKAATATIPIVFSAGTDPVRLGLVESFNRPGGNVTGVTMFSGIVLSKRLGLLRDVVPNLKTIAVLVNPTSANATADIKDVQMAANGLGMTVDVLNVAAAADVDAAFASFVQRRAGALLVGPDPFIDTQRHRIVALAAQYKAPAIYAWREFVDAGGLMSYGSRIVDAYHQAGIHTGRVLRGERPAELPIMQPTRFYLVLNLKTAKALGLTVPPTLLATADEVIE